MPSLYLIYFVCMNQNRSAFCTKFSNSSQVPWQQFDAFVDSLDMKQLGFKYAQTKETGRKPENPANMCKLYIYGYFNGIRSSRKIEKECKRSIEVMWLIRNITPHNKTINDFRKDNKKPLENLFKEFTMLCDMMGLIGKGMIAIDGSKFRASNIYHAKEIKNRTIIIKSRHA